MDTKLVDTPIVVGDHCELGSAKPVVVVLNILKRDRGSVRILKTPVNKE